jgi:D-lactate dehydrogenase (cytochrome)
VLLTDPDDEREIEAAEEVNRRLVQRALDMDGTCTGEHGIGIGKMGSLAQEMGEAVDVMRSLKRAVDPLDIMNPGKVL